jgi:HK97 family phage portal protein
VELIIDDIENALAVIAGAPRIDASANRITTSKDLDLWLRHGGIENDAGVTVNAETAMECQPVWTAVNLLSGLLAQLPLNVMRVDGDARETATDHPLQEIISSHGKPNAFQNSFTFREYATSQVALVGNAYFYKNMSRGELLELLPIPTENVTPKKDRNFNVFYDVVHDDGEIKTYRRNEIFHLMGRSKNGFVGDNVVHKMRNHIGLALAQDASAAKMFKNGALLLGALKKEGVLSDAAYERLKRQIEEKHTGVGNAYKPLLLEDGLSWQQMSQTAEQAQLLDSRKLQRSIVASIWNIPSHMVGDLEKATFSNIENLARQFVDYVLMQWIRRWEEAISCQLLSDADRKLYQIKFNVDGLLRGDAQSRAESYAKALGSGGHEPWMTVNEIRKKEDMPPIEGGDVRMLPANTNTNTGVEENDSN